MRAIRCVIHRGSFRDSEVDIHSRRSVVQWVGFVVDSCWNLASPSWLTFQKWESDVWDESSIGQKEASDQSSERHRNSSTYRSLDTPVMSLGASVEVQEKGVHVKKGRTRQSVKCGRRCCGHTRTFLLNNKSGQAQRSR